MEAVDVPLGILDTYTYESQVMLVAPGDIFIAASDGFPESRCPSGEMFGYERMQDSLTRSRHLPAKEIAKMLTDDVTSFSGSHPQDDDRTIIVIKVI